MGYGTGILMIDAACKFAKVHLKTPNFIHLISTDDFLYATKAPILNDKVSEIYNIGDDDVKTLREFLNVACQYWQVSKPKQMSIFFIRLAASTFEMFSRLAGAVSPLTNDFITIGMASYYSDTSRMKKEPLSELKYKTFKDGIKTL